MMPPTSIDGTDITGATIDGTDVQEITVDGQTVFTAEKIPVAFGNLILWYPFDSTEYGGANADDVTSIIGGSGDDTAYDGTVNGATYQSSAGVTDINAGANSGAFEFDSSSDNISFSGVPNQSEYSFCFWHKPSSTNTGRNRIFGDTEPGIHAHPGVNSARFTFDSFGSQLSTSTTITTGTYYHLVVTFDVSTGDGEMFKNGSSIATASGLGHAGFNDQGIAVHSGGEFLAGEVDDVRVYDKVLTSSEVSQIYTNTEP